MSIPGCNSTPRSDGAVFRGKTRESEQALSILVAWRIDPSSLINAKLCGFDEIDVMHNCGSKELCKGINIIKIREQEIVWTMKKVNVSNCKES